MLISLVLFLFGLTFIFFEFFVPGAVLGTFGGLLILLGFFYFWLATDSIAWTLLFVVSGLAILSIMIKSILWKMAHSKNDKAFYAKGDQSGFLASSYDINLIGKVGKAVTDLRPSGYVFVEGKRVPAISQMGYILKDSKVVITGGSLDSVTVMIEEDEENE